MLAKLIIPCLVNKYSHFMGPGCSIPPILKLHHIPVMCGGRQRATYHQVLGLDVGSFFDSSVQTGSEKTSTS